MVRLTLKQNGRQARITARSEAELKRKLQAWERTETRRLEQELQRELNRAAKKLSSRLRLRF